MKSIYAFLVAATLSSFALAQPAPPPPDGGKDKPDGPPPAERERGPRGGGPGGGPRDGRGPRDDGPGERGGPGGPGGPGMGMGGPGGEGRSMMGGGSDPRMAKFEVMRYYFDVVDRYARLAHDPQLAGISAVVAAGDILRPRGADVAIAYYEKVLPEAKIPAVQRAIRLQLVDLYKVAGKQDQALEQLRLMMTAEQGSEPVSPQPPPPPGR